MRVLLGILTIVLGFTARAHATEVCPYWPLVIAHRGASGYLPEHSLAAYQLALEQGADFIEVDLVPSRDGVLIIRHENELSHSTDVAKRAEFAHLYTKKQVDGIWQQGWFSEDFTLAELRTLKLKESMPRLRPQSAVQDGVYSIVTLAEVLELLSRHQQQTGRDVGIYIETKHPSYFAHIGKRHDGKPIATDITALLVQQLGKTSALPGQMYIQSFEVSNLVRLKHQLLPHVGLTRVKLVQLLGDSRQQFMQPKDSFSEPYDFYAASQGQLQLSELPSGLKALAGSRAHYGLLQTTEGLSAVASYADGIGPWRQDLYPQIGGVLPLLAEAAKAALVVHPYTYRAEADYLLRDGSGQQTSMQDELSWIYRQGIQGVFTDFPDIAVKIRAEVCKNGR
ncbi:glycerophosphodiester phosphodiesterase family protein [Rheinheimera sp. 4Y26]|uniref:glycerophosphodiester phosphodiesterase family protein n=1 Tax=Rheinheimera sp. 4Y26 TaxID=2977811 RepID=UPI0021B0F97E|nr:glycerophosphodiester phosphodiesterase family protein [Rheinheimera sp. 4Y26]MCT6699473.1 glycerophosphodiester phosphodiesterase family protein [Rheinheimera sp. 4Y26]